MADLDKAAREALPDDDFAVPDKRKLPIHDAAHAKLAWGMVDRTNGLSSEERSTAKARIKAKAESLGVDTKEWQLTAAMHFEAMALDMPEVGNHPNKMPFKGVLTRIDQPSDAPPGGASGKRTLIPRAVAEQALPTLLGMAVDFTQKFDGHDAQQKIGLITGAEIVGDAIEIEGYFYAKDFPETCKKIRAEKGALGFSFEADARIQDANADVWELSHCVFTGAAVLYKDLAAYTTTSLSAQAEKDKEMELKEIMEAVQSISAGMATLTKEVAEIKAGKGASLAGPIIDQVTPHVNAINACADAMEAAGIGNDPRAGHVGTLRNVAAHMAAAAVSGKVPMIYRDHDYLPDAKVEAAKIEAAAKEANKALEDKIAALTTQLTDLKASAFNKKEEPQRSTLSPEVARILAKAGMTEEVAGKELTVETMDKALEAAGITGRAAIEAKIKASMSGALKR